MDTELQPEKKDAASLTATEEKVESSSQTATTATTVEKKEPTLQEVVKAAFDKSVKENEEESSTSATEEKKESVSKKDTDEKPESSEEVTEESEESTETTQDKEDKGPVPYERFEKVDKERNDYKAYVEKVKPQLEDYSRLVNRLTADEVDGEDFRAMVDVLCLGTKDPAAALAKLDQVREHLRQQTGDSMPADLQAELDGIDQEVEDGTLSPKRADAMKKLAKENARLRGKGNISERQAQRSQAQIEAARQQQAITDCTSAVTAWKNRAQKTEPDFSDNSPKYKYFNKLFAAELTTQFAGKLPTPQEVVALADKLKLEVDTEFKGFRPTTKTNKVLSSTKSSTTKSEPKSMKEAVNQMLMERHNSKLPAA